jgi:hypothetical protein
LGVEWIALCAFRGALNRAEQLGMRLFVAFGANES